MNVTVNKKLERIVSTVLHHIDVESKLCEQIIIPTTNTELENYLTELLNEIKEKPQKREYGFLRETTELYTSLVSFSANQDLVKNLISTNVAKRLLDKEVIADHKYGHLGKAKDSDKKGHIKKGSFLQFLYREDKKISYLGVKIDHQSFLDEKDFTKRFGLSISKKLYKACLVSFDAQGIPSSVFVYDTNSSPSHYWWSDFLELRELRDDSFNTKKAIEAVVRVLNSIKTAFPVDHTILRNASIAAFKQQSEMKFDEFIINTFLNYNPDNPELSNKLPSLISKLSELPEKAGFDSMFTLVPKDVPFNITKIKLNNDMTLSIKEGVNNIEDKIWAETTSTGKKLIVIEAPDAYKFFAERKRVV